MLTPMPSKIYGILGLDSAFLSELPPDVFSPAAGLPFSPMVASTVILPSDDSLRTRGVYVLGGVNPNSKM